MLQFFGDNYGLIVLAAMLAFMVALALVSLTDRVPEQD